MHITINNKYKLKVPKNISIDKFKKIVKTKFDEKEGNNYSYYLKWNNMTIDPTINEKPVQVFINNTDKTFIQLYNDILDTDVTDTVVTNGSLKFSKSETSIQFFKTIRVPDDGNSYRLPPNLGSYKIDVDEKGNYNLPMFQKESMWLNFNSKIPVALKIGLGNINAITGEKWIDGELSQSPQNYVCLPSQPWLDGIMVSSNSNDGSIIENLVKQFVALPLNSKATIEQQLKDKSLIDNVEGGLRFEIFNKYLTDFQVYCTDSRKMINLEEIDKPLNNNYVFFSSRFNNKCDTLARFGIQNGDNIDVTQMFGNGELIVKTLTGNVYIIYFDESMTIKTIKGLLQNFIGCSVDQQRLIFAGIQLEDDITCKSYGICSNSTFHLVLRIRGGGDARYMMGVGAGGLIKQKIYLDDSQLSTYNMNSRQSAKIQMVNALIYGKLVGKKFDTTVSFASYIKYGYPWFDLYDEDEKSIEGCDNTTSMFKKIESISKFSDILVKGEEECCICLDNMANMIMDPCGHQMCTECFNEIKNEHKNMQCHLCRAFVNTRNIIVFSGIFSHDNNKDTFITILKGDVIKIHL
jgi:hypothetical protein